MSSVTGNACFNYQTGVILIKPVNFRGTKKWHGTQRVLCLLKVVIVLIKYWTKVNTSRYFSTVGLGLLLEVRSSCNINGVFFLSL